nr:MAG TPA: minor tail protein [Caudoviricetes sp.]
MASESIRDLVVRLSLESDSFSSNIRTITAQIKEARSDFALAAAGNKNYDKSVEGMTAHVVELEREMQLQNKAVDQYQRKLQKANDSLEKSYKKNQQLKSQLTESKNAYDALAQKVKETAQEYKSLKQLYGEDAPATQRVKARLEALKEELKKAGKEYSNLNQKVNVSNRTIQNNADKVARAKTELNNAKTAVINIKQQIDELNLKIKAAPWTSFAEQCDKAAKTLDSLGSKMESVGKKLSVAVTTPILAAGKSMIQASVDYESAFADVKKTVEATEGEFSDLSEQIIAMSKEVGQDASSIASVFAIAGQMGIETENLAEFARVMIDLGNSTDISATEAAEALSQFRNVTNMATDDFDRLGSAIVDLGNKNSTTESSIMDMATRIAAAGTQVGLSVQEILAMATALSSVGIEAEMGGSAFSKALIKIEVAAAEGADGLEDFASVAGMTNEAFYELWESNPALAFMSFIQGLSELDDEGISAIATLNDMGFKEVRLRDTLLRSTNAVDLLYKTLDESNEAWKSNSALTAETSKRYATTEYRLKNLKNSFTEIARRMGDDLNPLLQEFIDKGFEIVDWLDGLDKSQREAVVKIGAVAAAAGPLLIILGKLNKSVLSPLLKTFASFARACAAAGGGVKGLLSVLSGSPAVWLAVGAATLYALNQLKEYATGAAQTKQAMTDLEDVADRWARHQAESIYSGDGMGRFDLTESDFVNARKSLEAAQEWKDGLIAVWTDGKKESNAIVKEWTDSFAELNNGVITELNTLRENAAQTGVSGLSDQIDDDITTLNNMNEEVAKLLKKRQNGYLTEKEKLRLDELIDTRQKIMIKYDLVPAEGEEGYKNLLKQIEAEESRQRLEQGENFKTDMSLYGDGLLAAAQGYKAIRDQHEADYDTQYKLIDQIEDETKKTEALAELQDAYDKQRQEDLKDYAATIQQLYPKIANSDEFKTASENFDLLIEKIGLYNREDGKAKGETAQEISDLLAGWSEDDIVSYIGLLEQIHSLMSMGFTEDEVRKMFPDLGEAFNFDNLQSQLKYIYDFAKDNGFDGLANLIETQLPEEMQKIMVSLGIDTDDAAIDWQNFIDSIKDASIPVNATVTLDKYTQEAYDAFVENNPVKVKGVVSAIYGLGKYESKDDILTDAEAGNVAFYEDGLEISAAVAIDRVNGNDIVVVGDDGKLHVILVADVDLTGAKEAATAAFEDTGNTSFGNWVSRLKDFWNPETWGTKKGFGQSAKDLVQQIVDIGKGLENIKDIPILNWLYGSQSKNMGQDVLNRFSATDINNLATLVQTLSDAVKNGTATEDDIQNLQLLTEFFATLDTLGIGKNITAGVAQGMGDTSWTDTAEGVSADIVKALCEALGIHSPSTVMRDEVGAYLSEGIGEGLSNYDYTPYVAAVSEKIRRTLASALTYTTFYNIGRQAGAGLAAGIRAGSNSATTAITSVAQQIINAVKLALRINSPSRVMRDEVGVMTMRGWTEGIQMEASNTQKAISNAAHYLTDSASGIVSNMNSYDNRTTVNSSSSVNLHVENLQVRDEQDIHALAVEIATITKNNQRARGLRMA